MTWICTHYLEKQIEDVQNNVGYFDKTSNLQIPRNLQIHFDKIHTKPFIYVPPSIYH